MVRDMVNGERCVCVCVANESDLVFFASFYAPSHDLYYTSTYAQNMFHILKRGYGGHGNLGLGNRRSFAAPQRVIFSTSTDVRVTSVACTVGQVMPKGGTNGQKKAIVGSEGPHTVAVTACGKLFTFGTCHKGLLANLSAKPELSDTHDELLPYLGKFYNMRFYDNSVCRWRHLTDAIHVSKTIVDFFILHIYIYLCAS